MTDQSSPRRTTTAPISNSDTLEHLSDHLTIKPSRLYIIRFIASTRRNAITSSVCSEYCLSTKRKSRSIAPMLVSSSNSNKINSRHGGTSIFISPHFYRVESTRASTHPTPGRGVILSYSHHKLSCVQYDNMELIKTK